MPSSTSSYANQSCSNLDKADQIFGLSDCTKRSKNRPENSGIRGNGIEEKGNPMYGGHDVRGSFRGVMTADQPTMQKAPKPPRLMIDISSQNAIDTSEPHSLPITPPVSIGRELATDQTNWYLVELVNKIGSQEKSTAELIQRVTNLENVVEKQRKYLDELKKQFPQLT
ncbi:hypothetical protein DdX_05869 [Ditylenchus destructor]|uniref:Uncharacterized protein n=1 Tax=Ditylenchus destructor TaxID=166010 RepID=A0AAD4N8H5_9BILA|nr:hypothetical protein DdX_05869 [Ditylenchus destructor]